MIGAASYRLSLTVIFVTELPSWLLCQSWGGCFSTLSSMLDMPLTSPPSSQGQSPHVRPQSSQGQSQHTRPPFCQVQPSSLPDNTIQRKKKKPPNQPPLPSSAIDTSTLLPVDTVIRKNQKLLCESKPPTLAQKLASLPRMLAYFKEAVMLQCTVPREQDLCGLLEHELNQLKNMVFSFFS